MQLSSTVIEAVTVEELLVPGTTLLLSLLDESPPGLVQPAMPSVNTIAVAIMEISHFLFIQFSPYNFLLSCVPQGAFCFSAIGALRHAPFT